jgi:response regulator RpfG family c-di-GMP phosphodiesterase
LSNLWIKRFRFTDENKEGNQLGRRMERLEMEKRCVLVIDDDPWLCELVRTTFELEGIDVQEAHHAIEAERLILDRVPDAIVLDIGLPGIDGLFYCERLRESPRTATVPIIVISGSEEAGARASSVGATAFVRKPFDPLELLALIERSIGDTPFGHAFGPGVPAERASEQAAELRRLIDIGHRQHELLDQAYRRTVAALAAALESRDFGTSAHSQRVTAYAMRLAVEVAPALTDDPSLEWGFLLHDVGKIGIPDAILLKPGRLTASERQRMERHAVIGEQMLAGVPLLEGEGLRVVRSHHEHWDGEGYPDRLDRHDIPLGARIFAVADALDAMTDERPYRQPLTWEAAIAELRQNGGTQFDPDVIDGLAACEPDLIAIREQMHQKLAIAV